MCFSLFAGTTRPLPRSEWVEDGPLVNVRDLNESDAWTRAFFTKPETQYIGSDTICGCGFPSVMQDAYGNWPYYMDPIKDAEEIKENRKICSELCDMLALANEDWIELYGIWAGNEGKEPLIREEIALDDIRRECFRFKEGGFYRVKLRDTELPPAPYVMFRAGDC